MRSLCLLLAACTGVKTTSSSSSESTPSNPTSSATVDTTASTSDSGVITIGSISTTTGTTGATGDTGGTLGPVVATASCGGYAPGIAAVAVPLEPELNLIGVYQPDASGTIDVDIQRETEMVLVLSSYEPVEWNLTTAAGTNLTTVILNGYGQQTVIGATGTVDDHSPYQNWLGAYAYDWPSATGGSDTQAVVDAVELLSGLTLTSFTGCYEATAFRLD